MKSKILSFLNARPVMLAIVVVASCFSTLAAEDTSASSPSRAPQVVARVDGEPIDEADVSLEASRLLKSKAANGEATATIDAELKGEIIKQLINQRLVLRYLREEGRLASATEVDQAYLRFRQQIEATGKKVDDSLSKDFSTNATSMRRKLEWQLSWKKYLVTALTDESLAKYFERHRRDFDGTAIRVAHILFRGDGDVKADMALATEVQNEITQKKITFADAVRKYSKGRVDEGGDLGFIRRHEPMAESFSAAAFQLKKDEISPPVPSPAGVHLIQCLEVRPGELTLADVRSDVVTAATRYLFEWHAARQRPLAKIEFAK